MYPSSLESGDAVALALHIFGAVVWVGGMFAIYVCLRPALSTLEPLQRLRLMRATFFISLRACANNTVCERLGDDPATAETLSGLVNLICEKMIMEPRHLQAVYTKLREGARTAMEQRAQGSS